MNTTKPRPSSVKPRAIGVPVIDWSYADERRFLVLANAALVVGREAGSGADYVIENDGLSREHAKLVAASDGRVTVMDLDSTNGTFVNGERTSLSPLHAGDELQLGPDVRGVLRYAERGSNPAGLIERLTPQQLKIACLVAAGSTSAAIAEQLELSTRTIESHLARIFRRTEVRGRVELTRKLLAAALIPAADDEA